MYRFEGFLKTIRCYPLFDLLLNDRNTFLLLFFIAYTLNRDETPNFYGCQQGESRVSHRGCRFTDSQFRTAKKRLEELGLAIFETRGKGKGRKTYAKLTTIQMFDPNIPALFEDNPLNINAITPSKKNNATLSIRDDCDLNPNSQNLNDSTITPFNQHNPQSKTNDEQEDKKKEVRKKKSNPKEACKLQASREGLELAELLFQSILQIFPNRKRPTNLQTWAVDIDRIMSLDGKSFENAKEIIKYLPHDGFWCTNVLSGKKLRIHFDKLEQAKFESEIKKTASPSRFAAKITWAKEQCRPILESNPNAYFEFHDNHVIIGTNQKPFEDYTTIYFSTNGFEDQLDNSLRKWGLK